MTASTETTRGGDDVAAKAVEPGPDGSANDNWNSDPREDDGSLD